LQSQDFHIRVRTRLENPLISEVLKLNLVLESHLFFIEEDQEILILSGFKVDESQ